MMGTPVAFRNDSSSRKIMSEAVPVPPGLLMRTTSALTFASFCAFFRSSRTRPSRGTRASGFTVFFKCENLQRAGAFKIRGALNKLLTLTSEERARGVVAFSSGNHAQGVALAARMVGTTAVVCMPKDAPPLKVEATRNYGADIVVYDRHTEDREQVARAVASETGRVVVPPFDDEAIMAGQ